MNFSAVFSYFAAVTTAGIALIALARDPRSFVHRVFAAGMGLFALEAALSGFVYQATSIDKFLFWYRLQLKFRLSSCRK